MMQVNLKASEAVKHVEGMARRYAALQAECETLEGMARMYAALQSECETLRQQAAEHTALLQVRQRSVICKTTFEHLQGILTNYS